MILDFKPICIDKELSRRMSVMGFLCACMIVFIHCTPSPNVGTWQWWFANLFGADGLCRIAVPYFFLASGFSSGPRRPLTAVIIGLLVNFCMWYGIQKFGYNSQMPNPLSEGVGSAIINALGFNPDKINIGPIWYLRMLFLLVVISPVISWLIKRFGYLLPVALICVYGVYDTFYHFSDFWEYVISIRGIAYFSLGVYMRNENFFAFRGKKFILPAIIIGVGGLLVNTGARFITMPLVENVFDFLMVIPLMYAMWRITSFVRFPRWCIDNSFALYVMHMVFLNFSIVMISLVGLRESMLTSVIISFFRFFISVVGSLSLACLLKRAIPCSAQLLFGGR